ncbi:hypothetical protein MRX96_049898 [Rhipicephalus microplus]
MGFPSKVSFEVAQIRKVTSLPAPVVLVTMRNMKFSALSDLLGPQWHAKATYALIEARCDRDTAIENHHLQLEEDRLRFEIKCHDREMKLKEMELQQRQAEQEAKFKPKELELKQRRQELEALAEERRHNRGY